MSAQLPYITIPYLALVGEEDEPEVVCVVDHVAMGTAVLAVAAHTDATVTTIPIERLHVLSLINGQSGQTVGQQLAWQQFETGHQPFPTVDAPEVEVTHQPYSEMGPGEGTPPPASSVEQESES